MVAAPSTRPRTSSGLPNGTLDCTTAESASSTDTLFCCRLLRQLSSNLDSQLESEDRNRSLIPSFGIRGHPHILCKVPHVLLLCALRGKGVPLQEAKVVVASGHPLRLTKECALGASCSSSSERATRPRVAILVKPIDWQVHYGTSALSPYQVHTNTRVWHMHAFKWHTRVQYFSRPVLVNSNLSVYLWKRRACQKLRHDDEREMCRGDAKTKLKGKEAKREKPR